MGDVCRLSVEAMAENQIAYIHYIPLRCTTLDADVLHTKLAQAIMSFSNRSVLLYTRSQGNVMNICQYDNAI